MSDKMREEFERAVNRDWLESMIDFNRHGDGYENRDVDNAWWAWKESRAALCVELPALIGMDQPFTGTPISEIRAHNHYNEAVSACRDAIHAAGVKTK